MTDFERGPETHSLQSDIGPLLDSGQDNEDVRPVHTTDETHRAEVGQIDQPVDPALLLLEAFPGSYFI